MTELNDYDIPSRVSNTKPLYPVLDHEFPDEKNILDQIPPQLDDKFVVSKISKPSPAPRSSLKKEASFSKPIPKPRQRNSKTVENPVYFTVTVQQDECEDENKPRTIIVEESGSKQDKESNEEMANVVFEFDPLAPGRCPLKESQRRLRLTNSVFCSDFVLNDHQTCQNDEEKVDFYEDKFDLLSVSSAETLDIRLKEEEEKDDDSESCCSIDLEPPPFPPPPLPIGFSASTLDLNAISSEFDVEETENQEVVEDQPVPPPRYAIVQPPSPTDKPALPPKLNRCQTPETSINGSRCASMLSTCSDLSTSTFYADETTPSALQETTELTDSSEAPPLPPKNKSPSKKGWKLIQMVRSGSRRFSNASKNALLNQSTSETRQPKTREILAAKALRGIPCSGYLHKTGSNRREFRQRWCVLENSHFKYYLDDKSEIPQGAVHQDDIVSVGKLCDVPNVKNGSQEMHCFELATLKDKGRCYLFGSSTRAELERWMEQILISIAPQEFKSNDRDFTKAGFVYLRFGMTGKWQEAWLFLQDKNLMVTCKDEDRIESFDLRKVVSLEMQPADRQQSCLQGLEEGSPFNLVFPRHSIFIQASLRKETDNWFILLRNCIQPCDTTLDGQQLTNNNVPVIVDKCIAFVTIHGSTTEGIYRLNGVSSKVTKLLAILRQDARGYTIKLEEYNVHEVASTLKRYLRSLPEPLLTKRLYNQWLACRALMSVDEQLKSYDQLLRLLPEVNYCTLKSLIMHLRNISDASDSNLMSVRNLASIFGPTLTTCEKDSGVPSLLDANLEMDVIADLINNYQVLFKVSAEEVERESVIQKALLDIKEARNAKRPAGDILMGVYVYSRDWGKCLMVRLSPNLTAKDLCIHAIQNARMKERLEYISVYEVVCNGELERPLHFSEVVLSVTLRWAAWAGDEAKNNYLVIKKNELYHSILPLTRHPISMFSELRCADRKSKHFRKFLLEFKNARLSFYRDEKITQPDGTWNIEDITWYLGCESKRQGPTKWAFTFIEKSDDVKRTKDRPYFGCTICCTTEEEFHKWIAAMLIGEYPNALLAKRDVVDLMS